MPEQRPRNTRTLSRKLLRREVASERPEPDETELRAALERLRPRTRADCEGGPRPCPFLSCRYNLYVDVTPTGSLKLNFPELELDQVPETCALDVADRGGVTLAEIGRALNITRARAGQLELEALARAAAAVEDGEP